MSDVIDSDPCCKNDKDYYRISDLDQTEETEYRKQLLSQNNVHVKGLVLAGVTEDSIEPSDSCCKNEEDYDKISDLDRPEETKYPKRESQNYVRAKAMVPLGSAKDLTEPSEFESHLKYLLDEVLDWGRLSCPSDGDNEVSSNTDSCEEGKPSKDTEDGGSMIAPLVPWIKRQGRLSQVTLQLTYRSVFKDLKYLKVVEGYTNQQIFDMLDRRHYSDPDVAFAVLVQSYVAAGSVTKDNATTYQKLRGLLQLVKQRDIRQRNYIEGSLYFVLAALYMKTKLGKAWGYIQRAKLEMKTTEPSSWSALVFEREANILMACAQLRPQAKHKYMSAALDSYRLAREHYRNNPCNSAEHVMYNEAKYMMYMLYLKLEMPFPSMVVIWKDRNVLEEHAWDSKLNETELKQSESIVKNIKSQNFNFTDEYKYHHIYYLTTAEIYLQMRRAQVYLKKKNIEASLDSVHKAIDMCNNWGKDCAHDQVLMDTIVVKNRLSEVLKKLQDDILFSLTSVIFQRNRFSKRGDSDVQG